ncbi:MAG: YaeQ family protein [Burkholderiaceae bacterium]
MALRATVFKAQLAVSDMDRGRHAEHALIVARHPSETDERMMTRILAFAMHSSDTLSFGRGLSNVEEPDLIDRDLTGAIELWIEIGLPDERAILKACGRARQVVVFVYGHSADLGWKGIEAGLARARNLTVIQIASVESRAIEAMAQRAMNLQATIQDGIVWFSDATTTVELHPELLRSPV